MTESNNELASVLLDTASYGDDFDDKIETSNEFSAICLDSFKSPENTTTLIDAFSITSWSGDKRYMAPILASDDVDEPTELLIPNCKPTKLELLAASRIRKFNQKLCQVQSKPSDDPINSIAATSDLDDEEGGVLSKQKALLLNMKSKQQAIKAKLAEAARNDHDKFDRVRQISEKLRRRKANPTEAPLSDDNSLVARSRLQDEYIQSLSVKRHEKELSLNETKRRLERRAVILRSRVAADCVVNANCDESKSDVEGSDSDSVSDKKHHVVVVENTIILRDFADYKRKKGISNDTKVFSANKGFRDVVSCLEDRGWYYNAEGEGGFYDLMWTIKSLDLRQHQIEPWQLTNHFLRNTAITTKAGLLTSLKSMVWTTDTKPDEIFPRAYDLSIEDEISAFLNDFRTTFAVSTLKQISSIGTNSPVNQAVTRAAISICQRKVDLLEDAALDDNLLSVPAVTDVEWEVLENIPLREVGMLTDKTKDSLFIFMADENAAKQQNASERAEYQGLATELAVTSESCMKLTNDLLSKLEQVDTQFRLDGIGEGSHNLWIVKPAAMSRGRGIQTFRDLNKLLDYVDITKDGIAGSQLWIAQKYIENPLIIAKRKFDLRQWVLVTDWNPLTIWFNCECYARFGVEEYSASDNLLENQYVHLVNNSIGKNSKNFSNTVTEETTGVTIEGFMLSCEEFQDYLKKAYGVNHFKETIQAKMIDIVKKSLQSVQDMVEHRKNSWEIYGYDFMIDDSFRPWLIEVNSSPACDYSTKVTETFIKMALPDVFKVILDWKEWDKNKTSSAPPDTGSWQLIYLGEFMETPISSFGISISCCGTKLKTKPKRSLSVSSYVAKKSAIIQKTDEDQHDSNVREERVIVVRERVLKFERRQSFDIVQTQVLLDLDIDKGLNACSISKKASKPDAKESIAKQAMMETGNISDFFISGHNFKK